MKIKLPHKIQKVISKENKPPLLTLRLYKRHIVGILIFVIVAIMAYAAYFKFYMVLPQSSAHIMPQFPESLHNQRVLVISPHCDDETLGAGGLIQQALSQNSEVRVAIVTDCNHHEIGSIREAESREALTSLGVKQNGIDFLNFPEVESNKKINPAGLVLKEAVNKEISNFSPTIIISPHPDDTHIDHKSVGVAAQELVKDKYSTTKIAYYLIHYNFMRYPNPSGFHPSDFLLPPARLIGPSQKWYMLSLNQNEEDNKQEAVFKYKSQLSLKNPILHEILLDFVRQNELFMIPQ